MVEDKTQKPARGYTNFERLVIEYIAFNDGFINTRLRARRMLDEIAADAPPLGDPVASAADRRRWEKVLSFSKGIIDRLGTMEVTRSSVSETAYDTANVAMFIRNLATEALSVPQPQAAEPKGQEEQPSFTNPLTPYGMLVRALRIVAGATLYDMAKALLTTPAKLSAMEFGRAPVTQELAFDVAAYFDALGVPDTLAALTVSANARALLANGE